MTDPTWAPAPPSLELAGGEVHLWRVALDLPASLVEQRAAWLSAGERQRASRFYFERHRRRYVISQGALRAVLSRYLRVDPSTLQFERGPYGKPFLAGRQASAGVHFNLAHSHELAVIAVVRDCEVGVDVEQLRQQQDFDSIARRFFSPQEWETFSNLPEGQREVSFFQCWTRKEAFIKALGEGLSHPLDQFDVSLRPGEPARFLRIGGDAEEAHQWTLRSFVPEAGYVGAVALRGCGFSFQFFSYE